MKWLSYLYEGDLAYGILTPENKIIPAGTIFSNPPATLLDFIKEKPLVPELTGIDGHIDLAEVEIQVPFVPPNNIIAIGKNYYNHVLEMGSKETSQSIFLYLQRVLIVYYRITATLSYIKI